MPPKRAARGGPRGAGVTRARGRGGGGGRGRGRGGGRGGAPGGSDESYALPAVRRRRAAAAATNTTNQPVPAPAITRAALRNPQHRQTRNFVREYTSSVLRGSRAPPLSYGERQRRQRLQQQLQQRLGQLQQQLAHQLGQAPPPPPPPPPQPPQQLLQQPQAVQGQAPAQWTVAGLIGAALGGVRAGGAGAAAGGGGGSSGNGDDDDGSDGSDGGDDNDGTDDEEDESGAVDAPEGGASPEESADNRASNEEANQPSGSSTGTSESSRTPQAPATAHDDLEIEISDDEGAEAAQPSQARAFLELFDFNDQVPKPNTPSPTGSNDSSLPSSDQASIPSPREVLRYELGPELGAGSFGVVLASEDTNVHKLVAVKIMWMSHLARSDGKLHSQLRKYVRRPSFRREWTGGLPALESNEQYWEYLREIKYLKQINKNFILRFVDHAYQENVRYMITELCEGSLWGLWYKSGLSRELKPYVAWQAWVQMLRALTHIHKRKLVHQDIKPENIFFSTQRAAYLQFSFKLGDFGLARRVGARQDRVGTRWYQAPEVRGGRGQKRARWVETMSDIWSIFATFLFLLDDNIFDYQAPPRRPESVDRFPDEYRKLEEQDKPYKVVREHRKKCPPMKPWADMAKKKAIFRPSAREALELTKIEENNWSFCVLPEISYDSRGKAPITQAWEEDHWRNTSPDIARAVFDDGVQLARELRAKHRKKITPPWPESESSSSATSDSAQDPREHQGEGQEGRQTSNRSGSQAPGYGMPAGPGGAKIGVVADLSSSDNLY